MLLVNFKNCNKMDFLDFDEESKKLQTECNNLNESTVDLFKDQTECSQQLDDLLSKVNTIRDTLGMHKLEFSSESSITDLDMYLEHVFPFTVSDYIPDRNLRMQPIDYIIAALSGGFAVVIDVFFVKIPKDTMITSNGKRIFQEGGSLTGILRGLGLDVDGKASKWITVLEEQFKVPYDKSIDPDIVGLNPRTHRLHSLAHDPSIAGLIWGIKDIVSGTFSCIDKNGCLIVEKVADSDFENLFTAPILWLGHLLSDAFTRMGIPIPGWSYLQLLQFGSLGDRQRTIAEIARYMYLEGYDLRHLVSMTTTNAVIELIVRLYYHLVCKKRPGNFSLTAEKEYVEIKNKIKLHNMLFVAYSVASCGNIAKICIYQGNPTAINLPLWLGMIKESIVQVVIANRNSRCYEEVIENRQIIDEDFRQLYYSVLGK